MRISTVPLPFCKRTSPLTPVRRISFERVSMRNGPITSTARISSESRSRSPFRRENSRSVRADLKLTLSDRRNLGLRSRIPFVCVALVMRADSLTHDDMDLILVGGGYSDRAAITHHAQAAARWEVLLKLIVVAITMAEP